MSTNNFYNNGQGLFVFTNETLDTLDYDLTKPAVLYKYLNDFTTLPKGYNWDSDEKEVWLEKKVKTNKGYNLYVVGLVYYANGYYEGGQLILEQNLDELLDDALAYGSCDLPEPLDLYRENGVLYASTDDRDYKISNLHKIGISQTDRDNKVIKEALKQATDTTLSQLGTFSNGEGIYEEL